MASIVSRSIVSAVAASALRAASPSSARAAAKHRSVSSHASSSARGGRGGRIKMQQRHGRGLAAAAGGSAAPENGPNIAELVTKKNADNGVTVWSKSWCPFCKEVKALFDKYEVEYLAVELDKFHEEAAIQQALEELTSQRTVPNVFIGGNHVGGCDDTMALHRSGGLAEMLTAAGVTFKQP